MPVGPRGAADLPAASQSDRTDGTSLSCSLGPGFKYLRPATSIMMGAVNNERAGVRMGVREYLPVFGSETSTVYYECVDCGRTLEWNGNFCPICDGRVATYEF